MNVCNKCNTKDVIKTLHSHEICSKCFMLCCESSSDLSRCPIERCQSKLFDSEIRETLGDDNYRKIEKRLLTTKNIKKPNNGWKCTLCTYFNFPYIKFCDPCQSNRPIDYEPPKYYIPTKIEKDAIKLEQLNDEAEKKRNVAEENKKSESLKLLKYLTKQEVTMTLEKTECPVCMMEYEAGNAIILHSCLHTICKDCFKNYLVNTDHPKIKCPTDNCIGQIEDREIKKMLTAAEYENYQQLNLRTAEATEKLSFHCKAVNCTAWIVHDGYIKSFKCPLCKATNCIKCQAIHDNQSCEEFQKSKEINTADSLYFENLIKAGEAMLCSGCKCLVEKDKGCDWIRCRLCKTELCWATKGPRWGPKGHGDTSGGCRCRVNGVKCHPSCRYCH